MKNATIIQILDELNLPSLKEIASILNLDIDKNLRRDYITLLSRHNWTVEEREKLVEIFKKSKRNFTFYAPAQIVKSDDLPKRNKKEIVDWLSSSPPKKDNDEFIPGFEEISDEEGRITGTFTALSTRIVVVNKEALLENKIVNVPFCIFNEEGFVLIKTLNQKEGRLIRDCLMDTLELNKLYFAIPEGIRDDGADPKDFNGRARDLINDLNVEEINGVSLRIGGDTRIKRIRYKGNGDILEEEKIKHEIKEGAILDGIIGFIREGELLLEFSFKWGWIPNIKITAEDADREILEKVLMEIYKKYVKNMLK